MLLGISIQIASAEIDYSKLSAAEYKKTADILFDKSQNTQDKNEQGMYLAQSMGQYYILTKIKPLDPYAYVQIARAYDINKAYTKAKHYYYVAFNIDIKNPYTNFYFGESNYLQKNYNEALKYYLNAYNNGYSNNINLNKRLCEIYKKLGDENKSNIYANKIANLQK
jgi:TolA-binding protein